MYQNDTEFLAWLEANYPTIQDRWDEPAIENLYQWWIEEKQPYTGYTDEQVDEYNAYLDFLNTPEGRNFPTPADIDDYLANKDKWHEDLLHPSDERDAYDIYKAYGDLYGDPDDWYAADINMFLENIDVAYEQIDEWRDEAIREYQEYRDYASYRDIGTWVYQSVDDFVLNYDDAQIQLTGWQGIYQEGEAEREEAEQYALDPAEAERRREESYEYSQWAREKSKYAAEEQYRPEVEYGPAFYEQLEGVKGESVYYQDWMKRMYPELRQRFEATQPKEVGYPSREEARAAEAQTEAAWQNFLGGQDLEQEFYAQPAYARGERPAYFSQRLRSLSYG